MVADGKDQFEVSGFFKKNSKGKNEVKLTYSDGQAFYCHLIIQPKT